MQARDLFLLILDPLNRAHIEYMVTGAAAVVVYGEPRLTFDVDVVVDLREGQAHLLMSLFPSEGYSCPPEEIIRAELEKKENGHLDIIHRETGFKADIFLAGQDPLHYWGMARKRMVSFHGEDIAVAPPEYVIIRKLQYFKEGGSEKHLADIKAMLRVSREQIEFEPLEARVRELGLQKEWNMCETKWKD